MEALDDPIVEWGVASAALAGEVESGDTHLVRSSTGGLLAAVIDGLGHGGEAAAAARVCVSSLEPHVGDPLVSLLLRCHDAMRSTRGAAISLASFSRTDPVLTWLGVGNVAGVLLRADRRAEPEHLLVRSGVVGARLPRLSTSILPVRPGDTLVVATDGVRREASHVACCSADPAEHLARRVLLEGRSGVDDALVLVARYRGAAAAADRDEADGSVADRTAREGA